MITIYDLVEAFWLFGFLLSIAFFVLIISYFLLKIFLIFMNVKNNTPASHRRRASVISIGLLNCFPFGFTGLIVGFLTGSSRAPAVSALVPAILTFLGLLIAILSGKSKLRAAGANYAVFLFSSCLLLGTVLGGSSRDRHEDELLSLSVAKAQVDKEFYIKRYRTNLGLSSGPSNEK